MRVCVVGAGLAGLAAASTLLDAGADPIVLEARNRVGGRVWSERLANGAIVERGAEFIEHEHTVVHAFAARLGLRVVPTGMSYADRDPRGGLGTTRVAIRAALARLRDVLTEHPDVARGISLRSFLSKARLDPAACEAIAARVQITYAHPMADIDARVLQNISFAPVESGRLADGNQDMARRLADRLGNRVGLSQKVEWISWSERSIELRTGMETIHAEAVVLAVPASVMDQIRFQPPLPAWKLSSHRAVVYGHAAKLFIPLRTAPAPSSVLFVPDLFWTWTARGSDGTVRPVVSAFAGSAPALDRLGVFRGHVEWRRRLKRLRPELDLDSAGAVLSTWSDDPLARGAYSIPTISSPRARNEALERPVGRLYFAGEHTAGTWSGLMEGAMRSGIRAARQILAPHQ